MEGLVLRSTGSFYDVLAEDGHQFVCTVRGRIRLEGIRETNPVAVGDHVRLDTSNGACAITEILPRRNHIIRQAVKKAGHAHVLAANIDQALLVVTLAFPRTSTGFIDRFLVTAEAFGIPQLLVFNKQDILDEKEKQTQQELIDIYRKIGVTCHTTSAFEPQTELFALLQGKITLMAGHSGVGKSSLLNKIDPRIQQKTGDVSKFSKKGTHTTTFAEMFRIDKNTFIIDTPGVKEWGLVDMTEQELSDYFPEMRERRNYCKFGARCLHVNEPQCAIIAAVEAGEIAQSRYNNYLGMIAGDERK